MNPMFFQFLLLLDPPDTIPKHNEMYIRDFHN